MEDLRDEVIAKSVSGRSFLDVGGLWGEVNEKVSVAHAAGADRLGMLDIWQPQDHWWQVFRGRCEAAGIRQVQEVSGSIDSPYVLSAIGKFDVVHCSGVLYHCPNPMQTLRSLYTATIEKLIIAVAVMPSVVENEHGVARLDDERAVFIPGIEPATRSIYRLYIEQRYGGGAWGIDGVVDGWYFNDGTPNYGPWWWLWTAGYFAKLLKTAGFAIIEDRPQFEGTGHLFECNKLSANQENYGLY